MCRCVVDSYLEPHQPLNTSVTADGTGGKGSRRHFYLKVRQSATASCKYGQSLGTADRKCKAEREFQINTG